MDKLAGARDAFEQAGRCREMPGDVGRSRDCPLLFRPTTAAIAPLQGLDLDRDNATYVRCTKQALLPAISLLVTDEWHC